MDPANEIVDNKSEGTYVPYEGPRGGTGIMNVATGEVRYGKTMADVGGPYGRVGGRTLSANDWQSKIEGQSPEVTERVVEAYVVTDAEYPAEFVRNLAQELGTDERDENVPKLLAENPGAMKTAINRTINNPPATSPDPSEISWDTPRPPEYSGDIDVASTSAREIVESGAFEPQDKWIKDDRYSYDRALFIDRKISGMEALMDLGFGREAAVAIMDNAFDDSGARDRTNVEHVSVLEDYLKKWFGEDTANEFKKYLADPKRREVRYEQNDGVTDLPEVPEELLRSMDDGNLGGVARMFGLPSIRDAAPSPKSPEGPWPRGGKERKEFREQTIQKILEGVDHGYRFGGTRNNHKYGVYAPGGRRGDNRRPDDPHPHYVRTRLESIDNPDWDNRHPKKREDPEVYYPEGMEPPKLAENAHPGSATTSQNENVVGESVEKAEKFINELASKNMKKNDKTAKEIGKAAADRAFKGIVQKNWQRYEGPRGGRGWQNAVTGEILYQDEKPGGGDNGDGGGGDGGGGGGDDRLERAGGELRERYGGRRDDGISFTGADEYTGEELRERFNSGDVLDSLGIVSNYQEAENGIIQEHGFEASQAYNQEVLDVLEDTFNMEWDVPEMTGDEMGDLIRAGNMDTGDGTKVWERAMDRVEDKIAGAGDDASDPSELRDMFPEGWVNVGVVDDFGQAEAEILNRYGTDASRTYIEETADVLAERGQEMDTSFQTPEDTGNFINAANQGDPPAWQVAMNNLDEKIREQGAGDSKSRVDDGSMQIEKARAFIERDRKRR